MWIAVVVISLALVAIMIKYVLGTSGPNPFAIDTREPLKPMVFDRKLKNKVLKQGQLKIWPSALLLRFLSRQYIYKAKPAQRFFFFFSCSKYFGFHDTPNSLIPRLFPHSGFLASKVPQDLDAIVVGSGIGGLAIAVLLAKVGKKVLVLEQHDRAGGCCHTFTEQGFEFDVGENDFST